MQNNMHFVNCTFLSVIFRFINSLILLSSGRDLHNASLAGEIQNLGSLQRLEKL